MPKAGYTESEGEVRLALENNRTLDAPTSPFVLKTEVRDIH